jgi:hypothetical protein
MPGPVLHVGAGITCTHLAACTPATTDARVLVSGAAVLLVADTFPVAGCPFQVPVGAGTKPQPCVRIQWTVPAARVKVNGTPILTALSTGIGQSAEGIPQGPPIVSGVQPRVTAT